MLLEILKWALLVIAVWFLVALAVGCLIGKGIKVADTHAARLDVPVQDPHMRARGHHLRIMRRVD